MSSASSGRAGLPTQRARVAAFAVRNPRCKTAADALIALDRLQAGDHSPWLYPTENALHSGPMDKTVAAPDADDTGAA
ncbi:hypothetical protein ACFQLX_20900 [Streptomyces polyrhachis]|uniref:Uncharacterized protein n=1 Tax=Streptomyces polyrhachis TaxID=1282885 RepID=A0ABW2GIX1_9ACTN